MSYATVIRANEKRVAIGRALLAAGFKLWISAGVCDPAEDLFRDEYWDGEATAPNGAKVYVGYVKGFGPGQYVTVRYSHYTRDVALWPIIGKRKVTTVKNTVEWIKAVGK